MTGSRRLLGLDAGLRNTGWGVIDVSGNRLVHVAHGVISPPTDKPLSERLVDLHRGVLAVIHDHEPDEAAAEQTFVNKNPESTLKLGLARGVIMLAPALAGLPLSEYAPNRVKRAVVGVGHARKAQIQMMVTRILPGLHRLDTDSADALAVAICHAHYAAGADASTNGSGGTAAGGLQRAIAAALARETGQ